jgi:hypothetical protein
MSYNRPAGRQYGESDEDYKARVDAWEAAEASRLRKIILAWGSGITALIVVIAALWVYTVSTDTVPQDSVGVVVGGGPFDPAKKKVKGDSIEQPGRITHGTYDKVWTFPNSQTIRFQDYTTSVTTKDGKTVVLTGQLGFRFGAKQDKNGRWIEDPAAVMSFAKGIGARQYGQDRRRPGENIEGFKDFLDVMAVPEIKAAVKQSIGNVYCADFEPACRVIDPRSDVPDTNPDKVYGPLAKVIEQRVATKLGGSYLTDFRFTVKQIQLTADVDQNIQRLASEQAKTKAAEQAEKTAKAEAAAIREKGAALRSNKELVGVEIVKECNGNCTVIVDGSGKGVGMSLSGK